MKNITASLVLLLSMSGFTPQNEISQVLQKYMQWTITGEIGTNDNLFGKQVSFTYIKGSSRVSMSFEDYQFKINRAATLVPRSLMIKAIETEADRAQAVLSDHLSEEGYGLIHQISLTKTDNLWVINAIEIGVDMTSVGFHGN